MNSSSAHTTVLLHEAVQALLQAQSVFGGQDGAIALGSDAAPAGQWVDATFGRGGHSRHLLGQLGDAARLLVFDKDPEAIAQAQALAAQDGRVEVRHAGFREVADLLPASVDGLLMDLGISSPQIDTPERGFSFRFDGPLDMRMDPSRGMSVADWLAEAEVQAITDVIRDYGEERFAYSIAKAIVAQRQEQGPLQTTTELANLVARVVKTREGGQHPATRTFQALRIFINAELQELQEALEASLHILKPGGHLVVISFHSLEDRIVKQFITQHSKEQYDRRMPLAAPQPMLLKALQRIKPSAAEVAANPRARSAVMRVAQRTDVALTQLKG